VGRNDHAGSGCDSRESDECIRKSHVVFFLNGGETCYGARAPSRTNGSGWPGCEARKIERLVNLQAACEFDACLQEVGERRAAEGAARSRSAGGRQ